MNRYKSGENREQLSLMPMSYDDMIDEENPVRAIDVIVEDNGYRFVQEGDLWNAVR